MIRPLLWLLAGLVLGGIIHIVVILTLPALTEQSVWTRVAAIEADNRVVILDSVPAGQPNPLGLDPEMVYGLCRVDLAQGPAYVRGTLPDAFWSVALFDTSGKVAYSTTNRDGIGQVMDLGIFNADQTRLLAQQQIDVAEGTLVVETTSDKLLILVRLAPPQQVMAERFARSLAAVSCGTVAP
ncbi:MAG: hypothetical protein P0Y65_11365 [Candidatus Devosia phytovorans]|uniref:DUF1254 domain-containing protein n=1 Tax=Candidatus Devosia phytovorans TaxID=3121372 RepID=A0AAJ5VSM4_9HYPH|nr:hypothetical protein [Devosia sp.]WEK02808.1 MAG: hypothetical protein P0Y65_11365 [Devosia sp.]